VTSPLEPFVSFLPPSPREKNPESPHKRKTERMDILIDKTHLCAPQCSTRENTFYRNTLIRLAPRNTLIHRHFP